MYRWTERYALSVLFPPPNDSEFSGERSEPAAVPD